MAALNTDQFANAPAVQRAIRNAQRLLRPPPNVKPSEWAEAGGLRIPEGNARPGPYRVANAPYQREPVDQLVNPDCYRVTLQWGAQVGKTLGALIVQGYCIELRPRSQMMMQPSQDDLKVWLESKFNPLVNANRNLQELIAKPRGRVGVNNQSMKSYPGGAMMFAYSGSPRTMRGRSAPLVVCDEVDGYQATNEGHPVQLLWQRAATFGDDRFLLEISTPTLKEESYIEKAFIAGDQRHFHIACQECGHHQTLKWENVNWVGRVSTCIDDAEADLKDIDAHQPDTARYVCEGCGVLLDDGQRIAAIRNAEEHGAGWKASKPFKGHASYHINEMYSTFRRLKDIVQSYIDKISTDDLQTFVNVSLSQTWEEKGERADPEGLRARAMSEIWSTPVPAGGLYLTAGIDMQNDRLEVEVVAWGLGEESWSVKHAVLWGDTLQQDVWDDLDDLLAETSLHESGAQLPISAAVLDTGGTAGHTQAAYNYAKGKTGRRLFAGKGQGGWGIPIVQAPQRKQSGKRARKVDLFMVGVDEAKAIVMRRLGKTEPGPGYCHVPHDREEEWFKQVTAEKLVTKYVKGVPKREWHKPDKARNEALDCRVYAFAALKIMNPSLNRLAERLKVEKPEESDQKQPEIVKKPPVLPQNVVVKRSPEAQKQPEKAPEIPPQEAKPVPADNRRIKRSTSAAKRKPGGWVNSWR